MTSLQKEYFRYVSGSLRFGKPQSIQQADALEHFRALTPEQRTELLAGMYSTCTIKTYEKIITQPPGKSS